jgi:hypothetical protein
VLSIEIIIYFMYEKFTTIALLFAIAVNAQDDESNAEFLDPAPMPAFPEDKEFYTAIAIPSDEEFGDFPNNIAYAGFALWEDSENTDLQDWIDVIDWDAVDFPEPNFEVFGGGVGFIEEPSSGASGVDATVACFYMADVDETVWCAANSPAFGYTTSTVDLALMPEDGALEIEFKGAPNWLNYVKSSGNFEGQSGGVDDEFGNYYDAEINEWRIWAYNNGVRDWVKGKQDVWILQMIG